MFAGVLRQRWILSSPVSPKEETIPFLKQYAKILALFGGPTVSVVGRVSELVDPQDLPFLCASLRRAQSSLSPFQSDLISIFVLFSLLSVRIDISRRLPISRSSLTVAGSL